MYPVYIEEPASVLGRWLMQVSDPSDLISPWGFGIYRLLLGMYVLLIPTQLLDVCVSPRPYVDIVYRMRSGTTADVPPSATANALALDLQRRGRLRCSAETLQPTLQFLQGQGETHACCSSNQKTSINKSINQSINGWMGGWVDGWID